MKKIQMSLVMVGLLGGLSACAPQSASSADNKATTPAPATQSAERLDTREILPLNQMQRQHVLEEMRGLLVATQGVVEGLANEDMAAVAESASSVGMKALHTVENQENMKKLKMKQTAPEEFMTLGMSVHKSFDAMAQMAADGTAAKEIQLKLVDTMNACAACHASYQIPNP
jgi:hypothetical protein